jgi:CheY-like chemotaxis protein
MEWRALMIVNAEGAASSMTDAASMHAATGAALVLVVEDEELVRQFAVETLRDAGFEVLEAASAQDALHILEQRSDLKVMVTDVRMPGPVNGYFLAKRVRERWPYVEIILVSGYAAPSRQDINVEWDFLVKPYDSDELVRRVQSLARRGVSAR